MNFGLLLNNSFNFNVVVDSHHPCDAKVWISGDGIEDLNRFYEGIVVNLRRFDLGEVVLDVDEVFIGNDRDYDFFTFFKECMACE